LESGSISQDGVSEGLKSVERTNKMHNQKKAFLCEKAFH